MIPRFVTFDCAQTLVHIPKTWNLGALAVDAARKVGLNPPDGAALQYLRLYSHRLGEFWEINRSRDMEAADRFWHRLGYDWLTELKLPVDRLPELRDVADRLLFGDGSEVFTLFDDVIPCLDCLDRMGIRYGVVSNWDYSLHRVLKVLGIYGRFVVVKASLEEGVEKPDPRLFQIALHEAGFDPCEAMHVGDNEVDDIEGGAAASIRAVLIDRSIPKSTPWRIRTLIDLPEAFGWID
ncbi:MAG: HAD-IA family hydrolase [Fimbriimonas sp.]|nr:HAD-IA family hydrolase [Fimbriimonas sp.]